MSIDRVRVVDGPLSGQTIWVDSGAVSLKVSIAGEGGGLKRTLQYRRDGQMLVFVAEIDVPDPDAVVPRTRALP